MNLWRRLSPTIFAHNTWLTQSSTQVLGCDALFLNAVGDRKFYTLIIKYHCYYYDLLPNPANVVLFVVCMCVTMFGKL